MFVFQAGLLYNSPSFAEVPEKETDDWSNESYYAGKGEYIALEVLTSEHYQSASVVLSIGTLISMLTLPDGNKDDANNDENVTKTDGAKAADVNVDEAAEIRCG